MSDIKDRFKIVKKRHGDVDADIASIWQEQHRMQAEDKKLEKELLEARKKARELKRTLRRHQIGEASDKAYAAVKKLRVQARVTAKKLKTVSLQHKKATLAVTSMIIVMSFGLIIRSLSGTAPDKSTLGQNTESITSNQELPRETPQFAILYPSGLSVQNYDVVRISPDGNEPSYAYLDRFSDNDVIFRVTQQKIPKDFDLIKTATDFQATSIIQVDDVTVYHGYSEKGRMQSLIFTKNDILVLIRSPQKFDDTLWASYILSLQ